MFDVEGSVRSRFLRDGFVLLRGVLSAEDVVTVRSLAERSRERTPRREMYASEFFAEYALAVLPAHPSIMLALNEILGGEPWLYPNATVRQDWLVDWHRDAGFVHLDRGDMQVRYVQVGVYFQPNDRTGGGLDVAIGSHRMSENVSAWRDFGCKDACTIDSSAGDAVLWDARLIHRSSVPENPIAQSRIAAFWTCARADVDPKAFLAHLAGRTISDEPEHMRLRYVDIVTLRSCNDINALARTQLVHAGLRFALGR